MTKVLGINHPEVEALNQCKRLLTKDVRLHNQRRLEIRVADGIISETINTSAPIPNSRSIEITADSAVFCLLFQDFVSYAVTEEMFAQNNENEIFEGGCFRIYSNSYFLDFVEKSTWASPKFPGDLFHYQIRTLDHTVDVVTSNCPEICQNPKLSP